MLRLKFLIIFLPLLTVILFSQTIFPTMRGVIGRKPSVIYTYRLEVGGSQYVDGLGKVWTADATSQNFYSVADTTVVANTSDPTIYRTTAYGSDLAYSFTVPNGTYSVTLKFAEVYWTSAGNRLFDVYINGQQVLSNFDIFAAAGGMNIAYDRTFTGINVPSGTVSITTTSALDYAQFNGISLVRTGDATPVTVTHYGGWTGGGPTTTLTCTGTDDTTLVQNTLNSLPNGGTLDVISPVPCALSSAVSLSGRNNVRLTSSTNTGTFLFTKGSGSVPGTPYEGSEGAGFQISNSSSMLVDHLIFNFNHRAANFLYQNITNSSVEDSQFYDNVYSTTTGPYALAKCDNCSYIWFARNKVHDTISPPPYGVRGLWCGVDTGRACNNAHLLSNEIYNTQHSGLVTEGNCVEWANNLVYNAGAGQGTGGKFIHRNASCANDLHDNTFHDIYNGGHMFESSDNPAYTEFRNNYLYNIGTSGGTFGMIYFGGGSGVVSHHFRIHDNRCDNCRSIAGGILADDVWFSHISSTGTNRTIYMEQNWTNIHVDYTAAEGTITPNLGSPNVYNIYVNGSQIAMGIPSRKVYSIEALLLAISNPAPRLTRIGSTLHESAQ